MTVTLVLPVVGGDTGTWGSKIDTALVALETEVNTHETALDPHADRAYADTHKLDKSQNLADLSSASSARTALGLGTAALNNTGDFATTAAMNAAIASALAANRLVNL